MVNLVQNPHPPLPEVKIDPQDFRHYKAGSVTNRFIAQAMTSLLFLIYR